MKKILANNYQTFFSGLVLILLISSTFLGLQILHEETEVINHQDNNSLEGDKSL
jgi:hypothetical protein